MSIQARRERERAQRRQLIVSTARAVAEADGWDAVTTRRLAAEIEYSQPVLYSHFTGKDAIMAAAALEGFAELAAELRQSRDGLTGRPAMAAVAAAYLAFADRQPALYDAMFTLSAELSFGGPQGPEPLRDAFDQLVEVVRPLAGADVAGTDDLETLAETFWGALHGLITLERSHRLRAGRQDDRLALLTDRFFG